MIVRGVHIVNFRGVRELRLTGFPERGVVDPDLPGDADDAVVADSLRFAFRGGAGDAARVVTEGAGYAHVEVALTAAGGAKVSLFRGVDRRGSLQVSLREEDGLRVTGGEDAVRARLEQLVGAPLAVWEQATFIERPVAGPDLLRAPAGHVAAATPALRPAPLSASSEPAAPAVAAEVTELRDRAERAVDRLRRSLRAEALKERVDADYAALCEFGARLRRERTDVAVAADRAVAERDRVRARLRRVGEYRALLAQQRESPDRRPPAAKPPAPASPWTARAAAGVSVVLLLLLVYVRTTPDLAGERALAIALGLGLLAAMASYVHVASAAPARAPARASEPPRSAKDELREALRHRFADLGDPDDPRLLDDLRARLAPLDAEIEPLQKRLERLDEALAAFDVEAGRASRVTHGALPAARVEAASGLTPDERATDSVPRLGKLGDAVYHAAVERDALLAGGAETAAAAADAVRVALRALGDALGDAARAESALERAGLAAVGAAPVSRDPELCVRLSEAAAALGRRTPARAPSPEAPAPAAAPPRESRPDVAALLGDVVETITGRRFVLVQDGAKLDLRLQGPADAKPLAWASLPLDVRERLTLALRLRLAEAALGEGAGPDAPRPIVLVGRPSTIRDDAAIAQFVAAVAPRVAQVIVARGSPTPAPPEGDAARATPAAGGTAPAARRVTPR